MKSINLQLDAVKEAQELQECRIKAHEKALAKSTASLTVPIEETEDMQTQPTKNREHFDKLALQKNAQTKTVDAMQTEMINQMTK